MAANDAGVSGKDETPKAADVVICTNVLECVEDDYFNEVMGDLARCVKKVGYFVMGIGHPDYWRNVLNRYFYVGKVSIENGECVAVVGPKVTKMSKTSDKKPKIEDESKIITAPNIAGFKYNFAMN